MAQAQANPDLELEEAFAQRQMSRAIFWRLAAYMKPYRRTFAFNLVFTLLALGLWKFNKMEPRDWQWLRQGRANRR